SGCCLGELLQNALSTAKEFLLSEISLLAGAWLVNKHKVKDAKDANRSINADIDESYH
ncbi:24457_t:CDS:2, partial [Gigaspora rosea]